MQVKSWNCQQAHSHTNTGRCTYLEIEVVLQDKLGGAALGRTSNRRAHRLALGEEIEHREHVGGLVTRDKVLVDMH